MRRVRVVVRGRVQGVGYRHSMASAAREAGASGWVRNRRDGTVEAEIEGTTEQVEDVLAWAAQGPTAARVDGVSLTDVEATGDTGFEMRATL